MLWGFDGNRTVPIGDRVLNNPDLTELTLLACVISIAIRLTFTLSFLVADDFVVVVHVPLLTNTTSTNICSIRKYTVVHMDRL